MSLKRFYILLLSQLILLVGCNFKRPTDWSPSYDIHSKKPFGLYVLDRELGQLNGVRHVTKWRKNITSHLDQYEPWELSDSDTLGCILTISPDLRWDNKSYESLHVYINEGNVCMLFTNDIPQFILDSLHISLNSGIANFLSVKLDKKLKLCHNASVVGKLSCINADMGISGAYFYDYDSLQVNVLGYVHDKDGKKYANFIDIPIGSGHLYLMTEPVLLTNYYILDPNFRPFTEEILGFIPKNAEIFWKLGSSIDEDSASPLRFILSHTPLRIAFLLFIFGLLVFAFFTARRRQRIVPPQPKNTNSTIEFVRSLSTLYEQSDDINFIIKNKIKYLLNKIRDEYHLPTDELNDDFIRQLSVKTKKNPEQVRMLIQEVNKHLNYSFQAKENDLIRLNRFIEAVFLQTTSLKIKPKW